MKEEASLLIPRMSFLSLIDYDDTILLALVSYGNYTFPWKLIEKHKKKLVKEQ